MGWKERATIISDDARDVADSSWKSRATVIEDPASKDTSFLEKADTALENFGNAMTFGYLPHIQAGSRKAVDMVLPESMESGRSYVDLRDENIERQRQMTAENPKSAMGGLLASIPASFLLPDAGLSKIKALKTAANAGLLGKMAMGSVRTGIAGAGIGAISNPGDVEGDIQPAQPMERLKNAGIGAGTGLLMGGGIEGALNMPTLGKDMIKTASQKAFDALRPFKADVKKLGENLSKRMPEVGKTALEEGVIDWVPKEALDLSKKAIEQLKKKGTEFEYFLNKIDYALKEKVQGLTGKQLAEVGANASIPKVGVDKTTIGKKIMDDFVDNSGHPSSEGINAKVQEFVSKLTGGGENIIDVISAQKLKKAADKLANWKKNPTLNPLTLDEQINRALSTHLKDGIIDSADGAIKFLGAELDPQVVNQFKKVKKQYGNLASIKSIAGNRAKSDISNRTPSPSDYGVGLATAAGTLAKGVDPVLSLALSTAFGAANYAARKYGNQVLSKTLYSLGSKLENNKVLQSKVAQILQGYNEKRPEIAINALKNLSGGIEPTYTKKGLLNGN